LLEGDSVFQGFIYSNGSMTGLGELGGGGSVVAAMNQSGQVTGDSLTVDFENHAFLYANAEMIDLGTLGGGYSSAFALNDAGSVVGESSLDNGETHGFVYVGGEMVDLGTLGGTYSCAIALNSAGQVIGQSATANDEEMHGFIYSGASLVDLGTLGGDYSSPMSINALGQVVGDAALSNGNSHAFLWHNGVMLDLNTVLPPNSGWELQSAEFINDSGRIVGTGRLNDRFSWFVLDLATGGVNNPPAAVAGSDQTVECPASVALDGTKSTDPDGDTLTYEWSEGANVLSTAATFNVALSLGVHVITLKVTDPCGATSQATVTVRVVDTTAPTVACPPAMSIAVGPNCQAAVPNVLTQVTASDNCTAGGALAVTQSPAEGTLVGLGSVPIQLTAIDISGNSSTCNLLLTVVDSTAPSISAASPITLSAGANCQAAVPNVLANVLASDNCTPAELLTRAQTPAAGTPVGVGQSSILVSVTDASGNSATTSVVLNVVDASAPVILSAPPSITLSVGSTCQAAVPNVLPNIVASDNCTANDQLVATQNPSAGTLVSPGQSAITVTVNDSAGNSVATNIPLNVIDTTPPVILSTPSPIIVSAGANCQAPVPNALAAILVSDNCTPANELVITQSPEAGTLVSPGQNTITITATDATGNQSTRTIPLSVVDGAAPTIKSVCASPNVISPPNHRLVPVTVSVAATDGCDPTPPVSKIISISCNEPLAPGDAQITGDLTATLVATRAPTGEGRVYKITVQCKDASGNASIGCVNVTVIKGNGS